MAIMWADDPSYVYTGDGRSVGPSGKFDIWSGRKILTLNWTDKKSRIVGAGPSNAQPGGSRV